MQLTTTIVTFLLALTGAAASTVTCSTVGYTECPYTAATTSQLQSAISDFCGDDGASPYYEYQEILNVDLPGGYYSISSDRPGGFNQTVCNTALNKIVNDCTAAGFWIVGSYVVDVNGDDIQFNVVNCQTA